ncbi:MAG: DNA repair protein RecN [Clostridia bacterium]|nr:DNA repair protein RecN [Clostridia bacterium]
MLDALQIKNVAVIDEAQIELGEGLNVLTGETGAGKSILIDSINIILGERAGRDIIRHGTEKATIQALFSTADTGVLSQAESLGCEAADGAFLFARELTDKKSTVRVNGQLATAALLRDLSKHLINIHGQHDNQALLSPLQHIEFLDAFGKEAIADAKAQYTEIYTEYKQLKAAYANADKDLSEKLARIDYLNYAKDEIEQADLQDGEEEALAEEEHMLTNAQYIIENLAACYSALYDGEYTAYDACAAASSSLKNVADFSAQLSEVSEALTDAVYNLSDIASKIRAFRDSFEFDGARLADVQERLALIQALEKKYGNTIPDILARYEQICFELEDLQAETQDPESIKLALDATTEKLQAAADKLTDLRIAAASKMQVLVLLELADLEMSKTQFEIPIQPAADYKPDGKDDVEFLLSANPGEPVKPLSKIASGGELSRIMLALKTVLADTDSVETLIFDEIDTGVSGSAATKIGEKLRAIAKKKQVICITHLAQIAAMADNHYLIKKTTTDDTASTKVTLLDEEDRLAELARIIGGGSENETAMAHAKAMRERAILIQ